MNVDVIVPGKSESSLKGAPEFRWVKFIKNRKRICNRKVC